jgi:hypothetical protein
MVRITYPRNGEVFISDMYIRVTADAEDIGCGVSQVTLLLNGSPLQEITNAPYTNWWTVSSPGKLELRAVALNGCGLISTSPPVSVLV